jgi:chaperonin cofactor prefoldin
MGKEVRMNLFEINEKILNCFRISDDEVVDEETGEVLDSKYLDNLELQFDEKVENIAKWIKNLDSDAKQLKEQKMIFAARQKAAENKRDSLKKYLDSVLQGNAWDKSSDKSVKISYRSSQKVEITGDVPKEYLIKQEPKIDVAGIKEALKTGKKVKGADLIINNNIQIK